MVEAARVERRRRRLRLGMVGGGRGAFIGEAHRIGARLDDNYELVAGALSADPETAMRSGEDLLLDPARCYTDFETMARTEADRDDGIDAVAIVTPNHLHYRVARAFLEAGVDVICDKPMTTTLEDARSLADLVERTGRVFVLTHTNIGAPMVRQARAMVAAGRIGAIRIVQVEYPQDWLTRPIDLEGHKQAAWRTDPDRSGEGACIVDIGTHAFNLAAYVTGLRATALCADLATFVEGRRLDDNAHVLLRYENGARGMLWASQVAPGNDNGLRLRVYGETGGLEWFGERPDDLRYAVHGEPPRVVVKGGAEILPPAARISRLPPGHPEGTLEAFGALYSDAAELIRARREGREPDPLATEVPGAADGLHAMEFVHAAVASARRGGVWLPLGDG